LVEYPDIKIVIYNAGIQYSYISTEEIDGYNKIENEIRVNLISPMQIIYGFLPLLTTKQNPAIENVSSGLAFAPKNQHPFILLQSLEDL
jgi:uncharacterized oxidoreductase